MFEASINLKSNENIEELEKITFSLFLWEANFSSAKKKLSLIYSCLKFQRISRGINAHKRSTQEMKTFYLELK